MTVRCIQTSKQNDRKKINLTHRANALRKGRNSDAVTEWEDKEQENGINCILAVNPMFQCFVLH